MTSRTMKSAAALSLLCLGVSAGAAPPETYFDTIEGEFTGIYWIACLNGGAGDLVEVSVTYTQRVHGVYKDGSVPSFSQYLINENASGTGVGLESGDEYVMSYNYNRTFNNVKQLNDTDRNLTEKEQWLFVSKGGGENFIINVIAHYTVPASADEFDDYSADFYQGSFECL